MQIIFSKIPGGTQKKEVSYNLLLKNYFYFVFKPLITQLALGLSNNKSILAVIT